MGHRFNVAWRVVPCPRPGSEPWAATAERTNLTTGPRSRPPVISFLKSRKPTPISWYIFGCLPLLQMFAFVLVVNKFYNVNSEQILQFGILYAYGSNCTAMCLKQDHSHLQLNPWWVKKKKTHVRIYFPIGCLPFLGRIPILNYCGCSVWKRDVKRMWPQENKELERNWCIQT